MLTCSYRSIIYIFFAWMLAACGGGGGGGGVDASDGVIDTGSSNIRIIQLALVNANDQTSTITQVSDATPGIIVATISDSSGNPITNQIINFALDGTIGSLNPSSGSALTNSSGVARISLFAGTNAGAGRVTATSNFAIASNLQFSSLGDSPDTGDTDTNASVGTTVTLAVTKTSDGSAYNFPTEMVSQNEPAVVTATVTDADGPVAQKAVSFSTTAGEISLSNTLTNTAGQATISLTAGSVRTAGTITATYSGVTGSADFETAGDVQTNSTEPTIINVTLTDLNGNPLPNNTITDATPGRVNIELTRGGAARSNRLVSVSTTNGLLNPRDADGVASAITDSTGSASVTLNTGGLSGAGEISVVADGTASNSVLAFLIQSADIQIGDNSGATFSEGSLEIASSTLSSGSTTTISAYLVDANNSNAAYSTPTTISFSSNCALNGDAVIDSTIITDASGVATAAYVSKGTTGSCSGTDLITATATLGGNSITAQDTITVSAAPAASISQEGDANPSTIALQNTSGLGRQTSSTITFKVLDSNGFAAPGVDVSFAPSTTVGGLSVTPSTATSLADGTVQVQVNSGTVPTPVRIRAFFTEGGTEISTLSEQLSISTGIPDQNSFDLSLSEFSILAYDVNDVEVEVTAHAADHFNNPAPNGTTVSFISELGGSIPGQCTIENDEGSCTVTFRSTGTRPTADQRPNVTSRNQNDRFGRTTILGYAIGEESYGDLDGDNRYDIGEPVSHLSEAFIDLNESGDHDSTIIPATGFADWATVTFEEFINFNQANGFDSANSLYEGTLCDTAAASTHCQSLINVRDSAVIVLSTEDLNFYAFAGTSLDKTNLNFVERNGTGSASGVPSTPENTVLTGISSSVATGQPATPYALKNSEYNSDLQVVDDIDFVNFTTANITLIVTDKNGNPPANGTQFAFSCSQCNITGQNGYTVTNESHLLEIAIGFESQQSSTANGTFTVNITPPNGNTIGGPTLFTVTTR